MKKIEQPLFSIVKEAIRNVLETEFSTQIKLGSDFLPTSVTAGSQTAVNESGLPYVNVLWLGGSPVLKSQNNSVFTDEFLIDIKLSNRESFEHTCHIVRSILESQEYSTLLLPKGVVLKKKITILGVSEESSLQASLGTVSGGVKFQVELNQDISEVKGFTIKESQTTISVGDKEIHINNK